MSLSQNYLPKNKNLSDSVGYLKDLNLSLSYFSLMISKKEAERIVREYNIESTLKGYSGPLKDWKGEVSILNYPEIASKVLAEDVVFIMHPGCYCSYGFDVKPSCSRKKYPEYFNRLKSATHSVLGKIPVLIFPEYRYKTETLDFLGVDRDSVILVPTEGRPTSMPCATLRLDILQIEEGLFPNSLYEYAKYGKLWGELRDACLRDLRESLDPPIKIQVIDELTIL